MSSGCDHIACDIFLAAIADMALETGFAGRAHFQLIYKRLLAATVLCCRNNNFLPARAIMSYTELFKSCDMTIGSGDG